MRLSIDFSSLMGAINLMKPDRRGEFSMVLQKTNIDKFALQLEELEKGKDVSIRDVNVESGVLSYEGNHVILYIKENGAGARFHVSDCRTLKSMKATGRFERYVVTNNTSGEFVVGSGYYETKARLKVCQNCLRNLNYKGCNTEYNILHIVEHFNMAEFFSTYSSLFSHLPSRRAENALVGYPDDWSKISARHRAEHDFTCEHCKVNLRSNRSLLHVHHVNGVKTDNKPSNLRCLCIECHSKQPMHYHITLSHDVRREINDLRKQQGVIQKLDDWYQVLYYADPVVHGVLYAAKHAQYQLPEVNYVVEDQFAGTIAELEVAWSKHKIGVSVSRNDIEFASRNGWKVFTIDEFIENHSRDAYVLRY